MDLDTIVAIPARLESTRLPRKPLLLCGEHPLLWHVWQAAVRWAGAERTFIVTDSAEISATMAAYKARVVFDQMEYRNGSRRIFGVLDRLPRARFVVNLQCDEPELTPDDLDALLAVTPGADVGTLAAPPPRDDRMDDVKLVCSRTGRVLYFSRTRVAGAWHHVGVYCFDALGLSRAKTAPQGRLAGLEGLEQLDWLEAGAVIMAAHLDHRPLSINTQDDLDEFRRRVNGAIDDTGSEPAVAGG